MEGTTGRNEGELWNRVTGEHMTHGPADNWICLMMFDGFWSSWNGVCWLVKGLRSTSFKSSDTATAKVAWFPLIPLQTTTCNNVSGVWGYKHYKL